MKTNKRENWRNCENCIHNKVCTIVGTELDCFEHIYNADPQRYGDITALLQPIFEWIKTHYPNDGKFVVDKNSAQLIMEHKTFFSNEITSIENMIFNQEQKEE